MAAKPSKEVVLKYAKPIIYDFINKYGADIPDEHKEEIEGDAYVRLLEAYPRLDKELGWKSFTYNHCRGAVLDYLKFGKGTQENKWSIRKEEDHKSRSRNKIKERVFLESSDGEEYDLDQVIGEAGLFSEINIKEVNINWDLVARMSSCDESIHATAKWLRGFKIDEISRGFGVSRSKVAQLIQAFIFRFDDPAYCLDTWFLQTAYAFGLCGKLGLKPIDQSKVVGYPIGWNIAPINLDSNKIMEIRESVQLSLFEVEA